MFIFLINLIATKQSHIHDAIAKRLLRQQDHLLKIKLPHVPRNDAAVVRFALAGIAISPVIVIARSLNNFRFLIDDFSDEAISFPFIIARSLD